MVKSKTGYTFKGWYAERDYDGKCYYTNGTSGAWYTEGSQPSTYRRYLYEDEQTVYNSTPYNNDIVTLKAQWAPNYTIRFNGNDADSGTMADMSVTTATPFYSTQNAFSRGTDDMTHWYAKKGTLMYYTGANGAGWYTHGNQPTDM